jgi:hypothetical protein
VKPTIAVPLLTAVLGAASAARATTGYTDPGDNPSASCPLPTLAQCQNRDYSYSDCGIYRATRCDYLLKNAYESGYNSITASKSITEPTGLSAPGSVVTAKVLPTDLSAVTDEGHAGASYYANTLPVVMSEYRLASSQALPTGPAINSCSDYVYKKYYDYSRFEDAARACGNDAECVYQIAWHWGVPGLAQGTLYSLVDSSRAATPIVPQVLPGAGTEVPYDQLKNGFFEAPITSILTQSAYKNDPRVAEIQAEVTSGQTYYHITDRWHWHQQMHDQQGPDQLTDDDRAEIENRMDAFRLEAAQLASLQSALPLTQQPGISDGCGHVLYIPGSDDLLPPSIGGPGSIQGGVVSPSCTNPAPTLLQQNIQLMIDDLAKKLLDEWSHTRNGVVDHGCLKMSSNRCDWSPRRFANEYVGRLRKERETAYASCMNATSNYMPTAFEDRKDWIALEGYFPRALAAIAQEAQALPWKMTSGAPSHDTLRVDAPSAADRIGIPGILQGEYDYGAWWELTAHTTGGTVPQLCKVDTELNAHLLAAFTAPTTAELDAVKFPRHVIVDAKLDGWVNRYGDTLGIKTHLEVFDNWIFGNATSDATWSVGGSWEYAPPANSQTAKLFEYQESFSLLGIPCYVYLHVQGTTGYQFKLKLDATPPNACNGGYLDPNNLSGKETAMLTPTANVHVTASAGAGIRTLISVGVEANLDVVDARLPLTQTFSVVDNPNHPGEPAVQIGLDGHLYADVMRGSISLYAELLTERVDKEIVHWPGIHVDEDLGKTITIPLHILRTQFDRPQ